MFGHGQYRSSAQARTLRIADEAVGGALVDRSFHHCEIEGPAVLLFGSDVVFDGVTIDAGGAPGAPAAEQDGIRVERCEFRNCTFRLVGLEQAHDAAAWSEPGV